MPAPRRGCSVRPDLDELLTALVVGAGLARTRLDPCRAALVPSGSRPCSAGHYIRCRSSPPDLVAAVEAATLERSSAAATITFGSVYG